LGGALILLVRPEWGIGKYSELITKKGAKQEDLGRISESPKTRMPSIQGNQPGEEGVCTKELPGEKGGGQESLERGRVCGRGGAPGTCAKVLQEGTMIHIQLKTGSGIHEKSQLEGRGDTRKPNVKSKAPSCYVKGPRKGGHPLLRKGGGREQEKGDRQGKGKKIRRPGGEKTGP